MKQYKCPHCLNTDPKFLQDNGEDRSHPCFTLLCVNPLPAAATSNPEHWVDEPGQPVCGYQWEPNNDDL